MTSHPKDIELECIIHEFRNMDECLISVDVPRISDKIVEENLPEFILILDTSGSMHYDIPRFIGEVFPRTLEILGYNKKKIYIITFASESKNFNVDKEGVKSTGIVGDGGTYMEDVFEPLEQILNNNCKDKFIRLLSITDGILSDKEETIQLSDELHEKIKGKFHIISKVGRMVRQGEDPGQVDVKSLQSMARFSEMDKNKDVATIECEQKTEEMAKLIASLFLEDGMEQKIFIKSKDSILRSNPVADPNNKINLNGGKNKFWTKFAGFDELEKNLKVSFPGLDNMKPEDRPNIKVKFTLGEGMNTLNYLDILGDNLPGILQEYIANKVHGTDKSKEENDKLKGYLNNFESKLPGPRLDEKVVSNSLNEIDGIEDINALSNEDVRKLVNKQEKEFTKVKESMNDEVERLRKEKEKYVYKFEDIGDIQDLLKELEDATNLFIKNISTYKKTGVKEIAKKEQKRVNDQLELEKNMSPEIPKIIAKIRKLIVGINPDEPETTENIDKKAFLEIIGGQYDQIELKTNAIHDWMVTFKWVNNYALKEKEKKNIMKIVNELASASKKMSEAIKKLKELHDKVK